MSHILTPILTQPSGQVLTAKNWASIGIDHAAIQLTDLLIKPGIECLLEIKSIFEWIHWPGKLTVFIPKLFLHASNHETFKMVSKWNGEKYVFTIKQLQAVMTHLTHPKIIFSEYEHMESLTMHNKPLEDALKGMIYEFEPDTKYLKAYNLLSTQYINAHQTMALKCNCPACLQGLTKAYFHHLYHNTPLLCYRWLMLHNYWLSSMNTKSLKSLSKSISS